MQNILQLFARYGSHILFLGLEVFCFILIINFNKTQRDIYVNSINLLNGTLNQKLDNTRDFLYLKEINDSLNFENAQLIQRIINANPGTVSPFTNDSIDNYRVIPASICDKTIHLKNNYFTLCGGTRDGIDVGMGVISNNGVVGLVRSVSRDFSLVLPVINVLSKTSVVIKNSNYYGTMIWEDSNPLKMMVNEVPKHATFAVGDTIITSGYSTVFPKGIMVGRITNFSIEPGSATFSIDVEMSEDLANLEYTYVIDYRLKSQKDSLVNAAINE